MFNPIRVDSLATFLEAQAYQFTDYESGEPPTDIEQPPIKGAFALWNRFRLGNCA